MMMSVTSYPLPAKPANGKPPPCCLTGSAVVLTAVVTFALPTAVAVAFPVPFDGKLKKTM